MCIGYPDAVLRSRKKLNDDDDARVSRLTEQGQIEQGGGAPTGPLNEAVVELGEIVSKIRTVTGEEVADLRARLRVLDQRILLIERRLDDQATTKASRPAAASVTVVEDTAAEPEPTAPASAPDQFTSSQVESNEEQQPVEAAAVLHATPNKTGKPPKTGAKRRRRAAGL